MSTQKMTLYFTRAPLNAPLTIGFLRPYIETENPQWISLEPRAYLLKRDGKYLRGRLPNLSPLAAVLPENLDDLPLLNASIYKKDQWIHFHDAHPLSEEAGGILTWSTTASAEAKIMDDIERQQQKVLPWKDRARFGLEQDTALPERLDVERYYRQGKLMAWRLIPSFSNARTTP